jgi:hypothetical protein
MRSQIALSASVDSLKLAALRKDEVGKPFRKPCVGTQYLISS